MNLPAVGRDAVRGPDQPCSGVTVHLFNAVVQYRRHLILDLDVEDMARLEAEGSAKAKVRASSTICHTNFRFLTVLVSNGQSVRVGSVTPTLSGVCWSLGYRH